MTEYLILGHENFGVVEEVGRKVKGFRTGDLVVATVRRPCGCYTCKAGQSDMCYAGGYQSAASWDAMGSWLSTTSSRRSGSTRSRRALRRVGVLLEPMSVVEKGIDHAFLLQRRLDWRPRTGVVLGAGPIGLLGAAVMRTRGLDTHVVGREPATDRRVAPGEEDGRHYHSVAEKTLLDVKQEMPPIDIAIEATGAAGVAFDAMQILGKQRRALPAQPERRLENRRVAGRADQPGARPWATGSCSAASTPAIRHFAMGVKDLIAIEKKWPGVLRQLITTRLPWDQYDNWFAQRGIGIQNDAGDLIGLWIYPWSDIVVAAMPKPLLPERPMAPAVFHILIALADQPLHGYGIMPGHRRTQRRQAQIEPRDALRLDQADARGRPDRGKCRPGLGRR